MKKLLALLLTLALLVTALVACGNNDNPPDNNPDQPPSGANGDSTTDGNETVGGDETTDGNETTGGNETVGGDETAGGDETIGGNDTPTLEGKAVITLIGATFADGKTTETYDVDTLVSVVAPDKDGETFIAWKDSNGNVLERLNDFDFIATENVTLTAEYVKTASEGELYFDTDDGKTYYVAGVGTWKGNTLVIPDTYSGKPVVRIGNNVFKDNKDIITLTLPETIETIGDNAFENCSSLKTINLPKSLSEVPEFDNCGSLTTVYYDINECYFNNSAVRRVVVGDSVSVVNMSFIGWRGLKDITIPETVTSITIHNTDRKAYTINYEGTLDNWIVIDHPNIDFYWLNCEGGIPDEYTISVSEVKAKAFAGMRNLKKVIIPANVSGDFEELFGGSSLNSIVISEGITEIANSMFGGCYNLTEVKLPVSLETIGGYAFNGCSALKSIILPPNVTFLADNAFGYCTELVSITLPAEINWIAEGTFANCGKLTEWTISPFVEAIDSGAFEIYPTKVNYTGTQGEWESGIGSTHSYLFGAAEIVFKANTVYDFESGLRYTSNGDGTCWVSVIPNTDVTEFIIPETSPNGDKVVWIHSSLEN